MMQILFLLFLLFFCVFNKKEVLVVDGELLQFLEMCNVSGGDNKSKIKVDMKDVRYTKMGIKMQNLLDVFLPKKYYQPFTNNVLCGDGYCVVDAPICCGETPSFYCIPGGKKCCFAPRGKVTACDQSDECCVSENNATCCKKGTTCRKNGNKVSCVAEMCTRHETAESCLYSGEGCEWCCSQLRCVDKGQLCSSQKERPIKLGEVCLSSCQYVETCSRCLLNNSLKNWPDACVWCCATQSCIPVNRANKCGNSQIVETLSTCPACQANGGGVTPQLVGSLAQFVVMLSGIILIVGVLSCFGVVRGFIYFRRDFLAHNGMRLGDVDAQLTVRRHGFDMETFAPVQERVKSFFGRFFDKIFLIFKSKAKDTGVWEGLHNQSFNKGLIPCAGCSNLLYVSLVTFTANDTKAIVALDEKSTGTKNNNVKNAVDEFIVVLLPCSHTFCRCCVGLSSKEKKYVTGANEDITVTVPDGLGSTRTNYAMPEKMGTEGSTAALQEREGEEAASIRNTSFLREQQDKDVTLCFRGNDEGESNEIARRGESQRRIKRLKESLSRFFYRLRRGGGGGNFGLAEEKSAETVVLQKIGRKCPKCKRGVSDVFFPENILQL